MFYCLNSDFPFFNNLDSDEKGSVETSFVEKGIPAITFELDSAERVQPEIVERGVQGVLNNLIDSGALAGKVVIKNKTFIGNNWTRLRTERGGFQQLKITSKIRNLLLTFTRFYIKISRGENK
ncbi:MAG: hypothetical protein ACRC6B_05080 [Fusobacteriaceae bacterium]